MSQPGLLRAEPDAGPASPDPELWRAAVAGRIAAAVWRRWREGDVAATFSLLLGVDEEALALDRREGDAGEGGGEGKGEEEEEEAEQADAAPPVEEEKRP